MNKDSFFAKFAWFYRGNLSDMRVHAMNIWDRAVDTGLNIAQIIYDAIAVVLRILYLFLPVGPIYHIVTSKYLTAKEIERLAGYRASTGYRYKDGAYFHKEELARFKAETELKELEYENEWGVKMFCVSYTWSHKGVYGFGSANVEMEGLFSPDDKNSLIDKIKPLLKKDYPHFTGDIGVVILNWRKYDEPQGEPS